jgi:UDP-glucose 4-epimerase
MTGLLRPSPDDKNLVLGGAGFLGSHVAEALLRRGRAVRVFDRPHADMARLEEIPRGWEYVGGDFLNETDQAEALRGVSTVFHLISTTIPATSSLNPIYDVETNLTSTLRCLELALESGVKRIVFVSSGGTVYGRPQSLPITEEHPTEPLVSYGVVKLAIEKYLRLYWRLYGLSYRILRLSNPYGPRQDVAGAQGAASVFLGRAHAGLPIEIWGDGSVVRDYIYVGDAVDGILAAEASEGPEGLYNIGSGEGVSLNDLVAHIRDAAGRDVEVRMLPGRPFDVPANVLDIGKAGRDLGWSPRVPLAEGLRRTWEWLERSPRP